MDISPALKHFGISDTSTVLAVQQTREWIEQDNNGLLSAVKLINHLLGTSLTEQDIVKRQQYFADQTKATPQVWANTFAQAVVAAVIGAGCVVDDVDQLVKLAWSRTERFVVGTIHQWLFAVAEDVTVGGEVKTVTAEVDVQVEVKANGKIKKGGKEVLADALYQKYVASLNGAEYSNQAFIAILMKELGMSKGGATTYNYNMKKKHGGTIVAKSSK